MLFAGSVVMLYCADTVRMQDERLRRIVVNNLWMRLLVALPIWTVLLSGSHPALAETRVSPEQVILVIPQSHQQMLVTQSIPGRGDRADNLTRDVEYSFVTPGIAEIDERGRLRLLADGETELLVRHGHEQLSVLVAVIGIQIPPFVSFRHGASPVLSEAGCNTGTCHVQGEGQNGFKLSVFGFDPEADCHAIARDGWSRRVTPVSPDRRLLMMKSTARVSHGGELRKAHVWMNPGRPTPSWSSCRWNCRKPC